MAPADAPPGHENWFVMVNAPVNSGQDWDAEIAALRTRLLAKIRQRLGIDLGDKIVFEHIEDPRTIERRTGSGRGALYGNSSNSRMSAFSRHPNRRGNLKGLFFAGGSVHPGGGIPLCLASAKIVTDLIDKHPNYDR
jgi:phytoene dehydrogenase-like protein